MLISARFGPCQWTTGEDFPSRLDRAVDASNKAQLIEAKAERVEER
jgi:hypothetical protein